MSSTTEQIKERLSIVELVGSYIKLDKAGSNFKACCPFHNEKTPSFVISPDRESYYCFGCSAKGDIFTFVQEFEGVDFVGSLKILSERTGVEIKHDNSPDKSKKDLQFRLLEAATIFFEKHLEKEGGAQEYLKSRSLTEETIEKWRIGYAPQEWESLLNIFRQKKILDEDIEKVGLIKKGDKGKYYDRFRGRIMFPIFDPGGKVVGYTGRILEDDGKSAKYLNSPETDLFQKSKILYGYNFAKISIRKNDFSILVEGQMDAIMAQQAGYLNTVATSGTAMGEQQLTLLNRMSSRIVIALDGDGAGFKASERAWQIALALGMDVKIADMPEGKDPADVISESPKEWKKIIKKAKHIIDFLIDSLAKEGLRDRDIARRIHVGIIPYLVKLESPAERSHFVDTINRKFNINRDALWSEVENYKGERVEKKEIMAEKPKTPNAALDIYKTLLGIIAWQELKKEKDVDVDSIKEKIKESLGEKWSKFEERLSGDNSALIFETEKLYEDKIILEREVKELVDRLLIKSKEGELNFLNQELKQAETSGESEKVSELLGEINKISAELNKLK